MSNGGNVRVSEVPHNPEPTTKNFCLNCHNNKKYKLFLHISLTLSTLSPLMDRSTTNKGSTNDKQNVYILYLFTRCFSFIGGVTTLYTNRAVVFGRHCGGISRYCYNTFLTNKRGKQYVKSNRLLLRIVFIFTWLGGGLYRARRGQSIAPNSRMGNHIAWVISWCDI